MVPSERPLGPPATFSLINNISFLQRLPSPPREQFVSQMAAEKREQKEPELPPAPVSTTEHPHQEVIASTSEPKGLTKSASTTIRPKTDTSVVENAKEDFKRMMSDKNSDNYGFALEVIYKLAKDMFTESIAKGNELVFLYQYRKSGLFVPWCATWVQN